MQAALSFVASFIEQNGFFDTGKLTKRRHGTQQPYCQKRGKRIYHHLQFAISSGSGLTCFAASIKYLLAFVILFIFSTGLDIRKYPAFGNTLTLCVIPLFWNQNHFLS
jgi:hypothetical protein